MFTPKCPGRELETLPVPSAFVGAGLAVAVGELVLAAVVIAATAARKARKP